MKINALSLFDGISVGMESIKDLGWECNYFASEIEETGIQISKKIIRK